MFDDLKELDNTRRLNSKNCSFSLSEGGLLTARIPEISFEGRAFLSRAFPFRTKDEYISVLNEDKEEIGMIRSLSEFDEETKALLDAELEKKYFAPRIQRIMKLSERFGSSFWDCETNLGPLSFTVKDTNRSILRVSEDRVFVVDHDGCRYEIPSLAALDKKSLGKIEMYL